MLKKQIDYGLHDAYIYDILLEENGISLLFNDGVYLLDENGKETQLSAPCKMLINVENFDKSKIYAHCDFRKTHKNRFKNIEFTDLKKLLLKDKINIDLDFYSPFAQAISIKGTICRCFIELTIYDVVSIEFIFNN